MLINGKECPKRAPRNFKHGYAIQEDPAKYPTYQVWIDMRRRCHNPKNKAFKWYGGKGIKVCDRWRHSFANFLADMGNRPESMTLDRIDPHLDYEPGNCRWATQVQQQRNRTSNKLTEADAAEIRRLRGLGRPYKELIEQFGMCERMIRAISKGEKWA